MMQLENMTRGQMFWWIGGMIILWLFIWFVITRIGRSSNNKSSHGEPFLGILKKRYARGEISKEEYEDRSSDLRY